MKHDLIINDILTIPDAEIEITASRSGGPGGQHVNKADTRITVRWNPEQSQALNEEQKSRVIQNLGSQLTSEGDLIIHSSASRSQHQNKETALRLLAQKIKKALYVPKKRMKTVISQTAKEARLRTKKMHSMTKRMRQAKHHDE